MSGDNVVRRVVSTSNVERRTSNVERVFSVEGYWRGAWHVINPNTMRQVLVLVLSCLLFSAGCARHQGHPAILHQSAPICAILAGVDEGEVTCGEVQHWGDFGIGTFDGIDGEMILVDGECWQAASDGRLYPAPPQGKTPWAAVTTFAPHRREPLAPMAAGESLEQHLDRQMPPDNRCHAIRITGTFTAVKVRSFPRQSPPYPRLADIADQQRIFDHVQVQGSLIGYRMPSWTEGASVPGYHFHFIDKTRSLGGHVLHALIDTATLEVMDLASIQVDIPRSSDFSNADLSDRGQELNRVEKR
jgi:acetolactate decarboxylase